MTVLLIAAATFWWSLPPKLFDQPLSAAIYDHSGQLLGARIADDGQWRFDTPARVPEKLATSVMQFEDKRFRWHPGVDPLAMARAVWLNLSSGSIRSGGSTLSMQVIRLARGNPARTFGEKALEAMLAIRLELRYSKDEILSLYTGHAPFGGNVVGMEAAAWRYFGHSPEHLSWAEAATLAVLPNSPALIHPGRGRKLLLAKRNRVLEGLHAAGTLDALEYQLALAEPLPGAPRALPRLAPHLLDTLAARDPNATHLNTTLDRAMQQSVTRIINNRAQAYAAQGVHNAAAIVVDNHSLQVRAYVGNSAADERQFDSERGHAVDVIQSPRSTGSLLKPFLFAAMVQDGALQPSSLVPDVPMHFTGFKPENFDRSYRGAVRARDALAQSLNVPAVYMLREYGLDRFYDLLRQMDMSTLTRAPDNYGLTLILGGAEGRLWDMAQMYANLARISESGRRRGALRYAHLRVQAADDQQLGAATAIGSGAAWLTLEALQEVSRPELDRNWKNFASSRKLAWKTGTSFGQRDGWAVGVTPRYTVGIWVGNASGEGRAGLTGAAMAAPVLFDVLNELDDGGWFAMPQVNLKQVRVCRDDGYLPSDSCETEDQWVPADAHFQTVSRFHRTVHLDAAQLWRVDSRCERVGAMVHKSWFVLPPAQEYFYRMRNAAYRRVPDYRPDCRKLVQAEAAQRPFEIVYPDSSSAIYIPDDFGGQRGRVVFEAVHRVDDATLYWHVDDGYAGVTRTFHKLALDLPAGEHRLTLVDDEGHRQTRRFTVLGKAGVAQHLPN